MSGKTSGGFTDWATLSDQVSKLRAAAEKSQLNWKAIVGIAAAVITAAPALATAVNGCYGLELQERQHKDTLQLQSQQQQDDIRRRYLDLAINPGRDPFYRRQVLRYLKKTAARSDPPLAEWATEEEARVSDKINEIEKLRKNVADLVIANQTAEAEKKSATAALRAQLVEAQTRLKVAENPRSDIVDAAGVFDESAVETWRLAWCISESIRMVAGKQALCESSARRPDAPARAVRVKSYDDSSRLYRWVVRDAASDPWTECTCVGRPGS